MFNDVIPVDCCNENTSIKNVPREFHVLAELKSELNEKF